MQQITLFFKVRTQLKHFSVASNFLQFLHIKKYFIHCPWGFHLQCPYYMLCYKSWSGSHLMNAVNIRNFVMPMFCIKKKTTSVTRYLTLFILKSGTISWISGHAFYGIAFSQNCKFCSMISQQHTYLDLTPFILLKYTKFFFNV